MTSAATRATATPTGPSSTTKALQVEVWSDVVCPWCYIGKRRLEAAVSQFDQPVEIVWRSFQLDPQAPREGGPDVASHLGAKYGGGREAGLAMIENVSQVAAGEGLEYHLDRTHRVNTLDAHRLLHLAAETGLQDALKERLLRAYFTEGAAVGDHAVLESLAVEVGLPVDRVREVLSSRELADEVEQDQREASALGATGVPFFVLDRRYGVSGAQPVEHLLQALRQAWDTRQPALIMPLIGGPSDAAAAAGDTCGPDGC